MTYFLASILKKSFIWCEVSQSLTFFVRPSHMQRFNPLCQNFGLAFVTKLGWFNVQKKSLLILQDAASPIKIQVPGIPRNWKRTEESCARLVVTTAEGSTITTQEGFKWMCDAAAATRRSELLFDWGLDEVVYYSSFELLFIFSLFSHRHCKL